MTNGHTSKGISLSVIAVVPIKLNNERLPGKNTRLMCDGIPMMSHLLRTLAQTEGIDQTYVYCSSAEISDLVSQYGCELLIRDVMLDRPTTTSNDILRAFAHDVEADVYVLAHATSPFLSKDSLQSGISAVVSGEYDSALSVLRRQDFVWKAGAPQNYDPSEIPRTQDLEPIYIETSGFYVFERSLLVEHGRRVGFRASLIEVSEVEAADIDDLIDFEIADALLAAKMVGRADALGKPSE